MKKSVFVKKTEEFAQHLLDDFVKRLYVFDTIESTNRTAKDYANEGAEEGTVVIAKTQSHGRGRFDRLWESPEGGIYLSMILRPSVSVETTSLLPFVAALAVATTLETFGVQSTIKWPNDVRVRRKKIAGILLESEVKGDTISYVVIGIGINLNVDLSTLSLDLQLTSTSLVSELNQEIDFYDFLTKFFVHFDAYYSLFKKHQYKAIVDHWKRRSDTLGKCVRVQTASETVEGTAFDVDESGFLLLTTKTNEKRKIMSGDCFYLDELHHA